MTNERQNFEDRVTRSELRMIQRAANRRWATTPEMKALALQRVQEALEDEDHTRHIAAAAALIAIEKQNQADEHLEIRGAQEEVRPTPGLVQINQYFEAGATEDDRLRAFKQRMLGVTKP